MIDFPLAKIDIQRQHPPLYLGITALDDADDLCLHSGALSINGDKIHEEITRDYLSFPVPVTAFLL